MTDIASYCSYIYKRPDPTLRLAIQTSSTFDEHPILHPSFTALDCIDESWFSLLPLFHLSIIVGYHCCLAGLSLISYHQVAQPPVKVQWGKLLGISAMSNTPSGYSQNYEPVSPVDIVNGPKRGVGFASIDEKQTHATTRSIRTNSSSSTLSLKTPRTARFAEATSVNSPVRGPNESRSPFADPPNMADTKSKPADVGFGYISNDAVEQQATLRPDYNDPSGAPLKSALKTPGTPGRFLNPLSPTFREEQILEKQEDKTDIQQAKDLVCQLRGCIKVSR